MSEKHLTELPWKTLSMKHGVKDSVLGKALAEFGKSAEDDHDRRLKALDAIEKQAAALEKEHKKNKEVADYLGEVIQEADKSRKAVELLKKSAEKKTVGKEVEDGGDSGNSGVNLKEKLVAAMKKIKNSEPTAPPMEAMVCHAGKAFGALLATAVGGAQQKLLKELLKDEPQHKFIKGICTFGAGDVYTFVLDSVPSGAANGLKAFFQKQTGSTYKIRVGDSSGKMEEDLAEDGPVEGDPMAVFTQRFKALLPKIKEAIAAGLPGAAEVKLKAGGAGESAQKKDFALANRLLDEVEALLKNVGATASASNPEGDPMALFKQRFSALLPKIKEAIAAAGPDAQEIKRKAGEAGAEAQKKNFALANRLMDEAEGLLKPAGSVPPVSTPERLKAALEEWKAARLAAIDTLNELETAIASSENPELTEALIQLKAVRANIPAEPNTAQIISETEHYLADDDVVLDVCEFGEDIRPPLLEALTKIKAQIAA